MRYVDCIVTIKDERTITIEHWDGAKMRELEGLLGPDPFARLTVNRLNHWVNYALRLQEEDPKKRLYDIEDLRVIGLNLYRILFGDKRIEERFTKAYQFFKDDHRKEVIQRPNQEPESRMRLKLVFTKEAEKLSKLPWELLFIPGPDNDVDKGFFFAGQKTELILTRYVPETVPAPGVDLVSTQERPAATQEKLRVLVVAYTPQKLGTIVETDIKGLVDKIREFPNSDVRDLVNKAYDILRSEINDFKPHILHFIGHGRPGALAFVLDPKDLEYDIEIGGEQAIWIPGEQFAFLFNEHKPRLVFLHACKGAVSDSLEGFSSTARQLVYADIPAVVAMQYSISNQDAGTFARRFYEELGKGHDIDEAVKAGRLELGALYPSWAHPRFGTPVVYLQSNQALVLPIPPANGEGSSKLDETAKAAIFGARASPSVTVLTTAIGDDASAQVVAPADKRETR